MHASAEVGSAPFTSRIDVHRHIDMSPASASNEDRATKDT